MNAIPVHDTFAHCPRCGQATNKQGCNPFVCIGCEFTFHFGPAVAVGAIIANPMGQVLMFRRARDPGKDKYGLPGGFVDAGETAEAAIIREVQEEVGLRVESMIYLTSFVNCYEYKGLAAPVLDLFYVCNVESFECLAEAPEEVRALEFCKLTADHLNQMAFLSNRRALEMFLETSKK